MAPCRPSSSAGGAAGRAQLYFKLGRLLEKELENTRARKNTKALAELSSAYKTFLTTVAEAKTNQTYESLDWAGSSLLTLDAYPDAEKVFRRMLTEFSQDAQFLQQPGGSARMVLIRIKLASSLRGQRKFDEANSLLNEVLEHKPPYREALFEKGMLLEAEAEAGKGSWSAAIKHWEDLTSLHGACPPATRIILRRVVSRGLGLLEAEKPDQGPPGLDGRDAALSQCRRTRNESQVPGLARPSQMIAEGDVPCLLAQVMLSAGFFLGHASAALVVVLACGRAWADDVNLVPGAKLEQAIGGRVRGQVQSESPSEVVVQLGGTTTRVPTELIQSIKYDGQPASFALAEARESAGQLAEAAELFKKAATEMAGKEYPQQAALFREAEVLTDLAAVEPDRIKDAKDKLTKIRAVLSEKPPQLGRSAVPGPYPVGLR